MPKSRSCSRFTRVQGPRTFTARPDKAAKGVDPDNPFAALMALKNKD